jgi:PPK2 family polyphosphate:nucleotide phosphotransferase
MILAAPPHPYVVRPGEPFAAAAAPTAPPGNSGERAAWKEQLETERKRLGDWQHRLYADDRYGVLIVLQALDAAGKDGVIRHVFSGVNPVGLRVASFKRPSTTELEHDFLWRTTPALPERGHVTIFNRSYYEEVLVVKVHERLLAAQRRPVPASHEFWQGRYRAIVEHERHLANEGTVVLKFWLNVSKKEQRRRLLERIDQPAKHWKFDPGDLDERAHWSAYMAAYETCIAATSTPWAPWYVIPADDKHYMRLQVAEIVNSAMARLEVDFPQRTPADTERALRERNRLLAD